MPEKINPPGLRSVLPDLFAHGVVTALLVTGTYYLTADAAAAFAVFCGGILIDLDHLWDYAISVRWKHFSPAEFFRSQFIISGKVYIFLHSWELIAFLLAVGRIMHNQWLFLGAFSAGVHLAIDTAQRQNRLAYFLVYRFLEKFEVRTIFPEHRG